MVIYTTHSTSNLIEADVIKTFEAGTRNGLHFMIWHQEVFLPTHKQVFTFCIVFEVEVRPPRFLRKWLPGWKAVPVLIIDCFRRPPVGFLRLERVSRSYDLTFEVCGECGMICCESWICRKQVTFELGNTDHTFDAKITAQVGFCHVHMFHVYLHAVLLAIRLLCANKSRTRA